MARARSIKPGFYRDAALVELPIETRLLFPGLWMLADRAGRLEDKPKQIKMEIYPADNYDVDVLLNQLSGAGLIERYEVDGTRYIQIINFSKHQNPHRDEKASTIPAPCSHHASTVQTACKNEANPACTLTPYSLTPSTYNQTDPLPTATPPAPKKVKPVSDEESALQAVCRETWNAYSVAYQNRYGIAPVRNTKINSQIKQFCQRLPANESPNVAEFYISHNASFYTQKAHPVGSMLLDAEKLRTEWATNRVIEPSARGSPSSCSKEESRETASKLLTGRGSGNERMRDITGEAERITE